MQLSPSTLEVVVDTLGTGAASLAHMPTGAALPLSETTILDPHEVPARTPGGVALLVGIEPDHVDLERALRQVADHEFSAVVVKRLGRALDRLLDAACAAGLAVIVAADEIPWRDLDALLTAALRSTLGPRDDAAQAGRDELFSIANATAGVVGGSVAIEDLGERVLAYSTVPGQRIDDLRRQGILDRRVPSGSSDDERYRRVMSTDGVVRFPQMGTDMPRAATAIRAGNLPLGTIWAIESEAGLDDQAEAAILDGARLAALHMLRTQSAPDLDRMRRGELLRTLLEGTGSPDVAWPRLGFSPGERLALIGVAPSWAPEPEDRLLVTQVAREVTRICGALRPDAPIAVGTRAVYVLVAGGQAADAAARLARRIVPDVSRALRGRVYAAFTDERPGPRSLPMLRDEVDQILRVNAGGLSAPAVAALGDVQSSVMLLHIGDELERHPELRHPALQRMIDDDPERGAELARSVLAWLESGQNFQLAAERLNVHSNTLRYRLRRVRETACIDLNDPDQCLATWLELRLHLGAVAAGAPGGKRTVPGGR